MTQTEILMLLEQRPDHWFTKDEIMDKIGRCHNYHAKMAKLRLFKMLDYRRVFKIGIKEYKHIDGKTIRQPTKVPTFIYKSKGDSNATGWKAQ